MPWSGSLCPPWPDNEGVHMCPVSQSADRMTSRYITRYRIVRYRRHCWEWQFYQLHKETVLALHMTWIEVYPDHMESTISNVFPSKN